MSGVVRLGLRLAGLGAPTGSGRFGGVRSAMVALAAVVGTTLLLGVAAIARSELVLNPTVFDTAGMQILLASVVAVIAVPVLVLAATAGRLSASLRDRRLANLRLLGLSAGRTRLVSAIETGTAAAVGSIGGLVVFLAMRLPLSAWHPAGREWTAATLAPRWTDYLLALSLVPLAVVAVSALPQRMGTKDAVVSARRADQQRPRLSRLLPLLFGVALAAHVIVSGEGPNPDYNMLAAPMFAGMVLLGAGMILAVPIFVRLVADLLVRRTDNPVLLIAGRRLQAQPGAMSRVVAGLLIGLFIVTGARALVVAFEDTPMYRSESRIYSTGQIGSVRTRMVDLPEVEQRLAQLDGVRTTATFPRLGTASCDRLDAADCLNAVVGTCAELRVALPDVGPCRDDQAQWLGDPATIRAVGSLPDRLRWHAMRGDRARASVLSVPTPEIVLTDDEYQGFSYASVFIPETLAAASAALSETQADVVVVAEPGREVQAVIDPLLRSGAIDSSMSPGTSYYDFVAGLRTVVWAIAAIILAVGLLSFAIAAIDRGISRRAEVISLQLAGVSPRILRRTQWIEVALPLAGGSVLAIGFGLFSGASYLAYGDILEQLPWQQTTTLAAISAASSSLVAAVTVIAASPRIRPDLIRTE